MGVRGRGGSLHVVNGEPVDHQVVVADEDSLELADEVLERVALLGAVVAVGAGEVVSGGVESAEPGDEGGGAHGVEGVGGESEEGAAGVVASGGVVVVFFLGAGEEWAHGGDGGVAEVSREEGDGDGGIDGERVRGVEGRSRT